MHSLAGLFTARYGMSLLGATVTLVILVPASALALSLVSQSRVVDASATLRPFMSPPQVVSEETQSAPDFGPFAGVANATFSASGLGVMNGNATQNSFIQEPQPGSSLSTGITGRVEADASHVGVTPTDTSSAGSSVYALTFDVTTDQPYKLVAAASVSNSFISSASANTQVQVELIRNGTDIVEQFALASLPAGGSQGNMLDHSGTLTPGTYLLRVDASAGADAIRTIPPGLGSFATSTATFDVALTVPEPGTALLVGSGLAGLVILGRRRTGS